MASSFRLLVASFLAALLPAFLYPKPAHPAGFEAERQRMVDVDLRGRDIQDSRVISAMLQVPRHEFVGADHQHLAYADSPLPIGGGRKSVV